jgi:phosphoserine phosphatase RsbU/P
MLKLAGTDGTKYYSWTLEPGEYQVGRTPDNSFQIPHKTVSRKHAVITVDIDGRCTIGDSGSHNGTFINGKRITCRTEVECDDSIMFGQTEFKLSESDGKNDLSAVPTRTKFSDGDLQKSVFLDINEALKPLPTKVTEQPELLSSFIDMAKMLVLNEPKSIMLERSLERVARVIKAERFAVLFVSEENEDDVYTGATLLSGKKDPGAFHLSRTIIREIMSDKNAILIGNPMDDPRFAGKKSIIMSEMKSALAVPLFDEGRVLGVLYADTTNPAHRYGDDHLRIMAAFGNIIASRLLNYELLSERQQKQILDAELSRASQIQKTLLISSLPDIPDYDICTFQEQSRSVGGDLYDVEKLPDGSVLFLVADVSGKGMGAALLMSNILASFRILYNSPDFDLANIVRQVSLQMHRYSAPGDFATLFIGVAEPDGETIRFINAGHNPPLVVRADGTIDQLEASGVMIGAFDFSDWSEQSVTLSSGDLLYVFTDGVTEAERDDEQYGDDRNERLVREYRTHNAREIISHIMDDINEYMGDAPRSDDITMLLIKKAE